MDAPLTLEWHQASGVLALSWDEGSITEITSQQLRQACRCGLCESLRRAGLVVLAAQDIRLTQIIPVGEMGVQLHFSDGHDRGIYPWPYLYKLVDEQYPQPEIQESVA
jgi:DUF971 family protein